MNDLTAVPMAAGGPAREPHDREAARDARVRAVTAVVVLGVALATGGQASARPHQPRTNVSASATAFTHSGALHGVAATSARNAWAVGETGNYTRTLIVHWNGTAWTRVASPSPTPDPGGEAVYGLVGVAATSADNAWAVGTSGSRTLVLRWNGTAWTQLASPMGSLNSVAATSATNAWAVGTTSNYRKTLILHWNGTAWTRVPGPRGSLRSVAATSAHKAWAVGSTGTGKTLILHWNGKTWKRVRSPSPYAKQLGEAGLAGVAIASVRSAWAVGGASICGCGPGASLVEHWNGKTWKRVTTPTIGGGTDLQGVAVTSKRRTWVVGETGSGDGPTKTLILRRTGAHWKRVLSPHRQTYGELNGVAMTSASNAWAVGDAYSNPHHKVGVRKNDTTLILHWNGNAWK